MKTRITASLLAIAALSLTLTRSADETPAGDTTATHVPSYRAAGAEDLGAVTAEGVKANLMLTAGARALIKAGTFDVADPAFDEKKFTDAVLAELSTMLANFRTQVEAPKMTEAFFVIEDFGARRSGTICETYVNTRIMACDFRRVHKMLLGYSTYRFPMVLIHEFTHAHQYAVAKYAAVPLTSVDAGKLPANDRELKAIAVEMGGLALRYGLKPASSNYLAMVNGSSCTAAAIGELDEKKLNQAARRCQLGTLPWLLQMKTVTSPTTADAQALLVEIARKVALSKSAGLQAYEDAFADLKLEMGGKPFTVSSLRTESQRVFTPPPAPPAP